MSKPNQIPRTRHLFPEAAAWYLYGQRALLRVRWALREDQDWFPAWSIGAIAGVTGVMLAVLLFFLDEPQLAAAPSVKAEVKKPIVEIGALLQQDVKPILSPGFFPDLSLKRSDLTSTVLLRTKLPYYWNQNETLALQSRPKRIQERFIKDDWTRTTPEFAVADTFRPYLLQGATIPLTPSYVTTSGQRTLFDGIQSSRIQRVLVEKHAVPVTSLGQPYSYVIQVTNRSDDAIDEVYVHEKISSIHRVTEVDPPAAVQGDELVWALGKLAAKSRTALRVTLTPDSVRSIRTETRLKNRSKIGGLAHVAELVLEEPELLPVQPEVEPAKEPEVEFVPIIREPAPSPVSVKPKPFPELKLSVTPVHVLRQGETLSLRFNVSNVGTAAAENVTLFVYLSGEFKHKYGKRVKHTITRLEPGQTRTALFQATAKKVGTGQLSASLRLAGDEKRTENLRIRIEQEPKSLSNRSEPTTSVEFPKPKPADTSSNKFALNQPAATTQWTKFSE